MLPNLVVWFLFVLISRPNSHIPKYIALPSCFNSLDQKRKKRKSEAEDLRSGAVSASGSGILKKSKRYVCDRQMMCGRMENSEVDEPARFDSLANMFSLCTGHSCSSQSGLIKIGATVRILFYNWTYAVVCVSIRQELSANVNPLSQVAAKHGKQKDKASEEWIQAVVLNYYPDKNK